MCQLQNYTPGETCATCKNATAPGNTGTCGQCIDVELQTKKPFTNWQPKEGQK